MLVETKMMILMTESVYEKDVTIINIYALQRSLEILEGTLLELKEEMNS